MFRRYKRGRLDSFYRVWLKSFTLLLVLFFGLFITFVTSIIFTRLDLNIASLLERAQAISWQEYNRFFDTSTSGLYVLANELETGVVPEYQRLSPILNAQPAFDLWFVTDQRGRVLLSSANSDSPVLQQLSAAVQSAWQSGAAVGVSEMVTLDQLRSFSPELAGRAVVLVQDAVEEEEYGAMLQVAAVPYRDKTQGTAGALVAAHLLNNDPGVAERIREEIPESFNTISTGGLRVAGNLSITETPTYYGIGRRQSAALVDATEQGQRYQGRVNLTTRLVHLVVSDPIRNSQGQVIGALTTGHPSQGLANLKQDTVLYIMLSALVCLAAVLSASALASKRLAVPIVNLSKVARLIDEAEVIRPEHVAMIKTVPSANTREIEDLQLCFARMTASLYDKNQEILGYLDEIKSERNELQSLADQLQEANATLEARVEEKTLELRNAMTDLVESNNMKSKFLANTSHELRTPLNSIIGFSDMLTGGIYGELTEPQRKRVEIIGDSARYLLQLINDLLDVSLVAQGKLALERQQIDLAELIASVITIIRHDCDQNHIRISAELIEDIPSLYVDPTRIKQVLYNVLSNAVKFTPEGGEISVRTGVTPQEVSIAVQDTGIGIGESDQFYVFDEFYQAENTGYRKRVGFGLGLPLSKKLVEMHGGRIDLRSVLGQGTTVTIHLPVA